MKYDTILFDLDGTLIASEEGITRSMQLALAAFGIREKQSDLSHFIGPPLNVELAATYHMETDKISGIISRFRERYETVGLYEAHPYPGIPELLQELKGNGCRLAIATSKPQEAMRRVADHFRLAPYFEILCGSRVEDELENRTGKDNKAHVIETALRLLGETGNIGRAVMIGDSPYDIIGAKANRLPSVAVTYGYGNKKALLEEKPTFVVKNVEELAALLKCEK